MRLVLVVLGVLTSSVYDVRSKEEFPLPSVVLSNPSRAALEERLRHLEARIAFLEEKPGTLEELRIYQQRVDRIKSRLGHPVAPFSLNPLDHLPKSQKLKSTVAGTSLGAEQPLPFGRPSEPSQEKLPSPVKLSSVHGTSGFFHRPQIIQGVQKVIEDHGGIHPRSSFAAELPPPRNQRHREEAFSKRGVIIDGEEPPAAMTGVQPSDSSFEASSSTPTKTPQMTGKDVWGASPQEPKYTGGVSKRETPNNTSAEGVWSVSETAKIGWSVSPPSQPLSFGGSFGSSAPVLSSTPKRKIEHNCSFSPKKLIRIWESAP